MADTTAAMFLLRKIGAIFRGRVTMAQVVLACVLGGMLGFVPGFFLPQDTGGGFLQAPGLIVTLLALALILNTNLGLFGLALAVSKLLSLLLLPASVAVGRVLLEGPTEGLFRWLVQAPVFAWFGFQYYATTGGIVIGLLFGVALGLALWMTISALRTKLAHAEEGSERFQAVTSKWYVRFLGWLFLGKGKGKKHSWQELAEQGRKGRPIRITGVVLAAVLVGLVFALQGVLGSEWFQRRAREGLTRWNGATVDLAKTGLDLFDGKLAFGGLAMADVEELTKDVFRARTLDLDLSTSEFLAGRVVIDSVVSEEAASGVDRETPGERWKGEGEDPKPVPPPPEEAPGRTLEDYLAEAEVWKQRLEKLGDYLKKLTEGDDEAFDPNETPEEREERLARETEQRGLVGLVATHLLPVTPAVTIKELRFDGVVAADLDGDLVDVRGSNLSSHPGRSDQRMELSVAARSGRFGFTFGFDPGEAGGPTMDLEIKDLPVDALASALKVLPLSGGTIDLRLNGRVDVAREGGTWIDLPLEVAMKGTSLVIDDQKTPLDTVRMPIGLKGPLAAPRVDVDTQAFSDALVAQGRAELAKRVRTEAAKWLPEGLGDIGEGAGALLEGSKTAEDLAEEARKRAAEQAEKLLPGLGGLLPGGGDKKKKDKDK